MCQTRPNKITFIQRNTCLTCRRRRRTADNPLVVFFKLARRPYSSSIYFYWTNLCFASSITTVPNSSMSLFSNPNRLVVHNLFQEAPFSSLDNQGMPILSYLSIYALLCHRPAHNQCGLDAYEHCWTDIHVRCKD